MREFMLLWGLYMANRRRFHQCFYAPGYAETALIKYTEKADGRRST